MLKEYHKIDGLYMREETGNHKLIDSVFRNPAVEFLKDNEWVFTEKVDGTNVRIFWDCHKVSFQGRTDRSNLPKPLLDFLKKTFGEESIEELFEQIFGEKEVIFFGEGYGPKIQNGGLYRSDISFVLFDVCVDGIYLERKNVEDIAKSFGIDIVPIILTGTIQKAVDFIKQHPQSTMGRAMMEGVVGHPKVELCDKNGKRIIVKIKWNDMKELLKEE